MMNVEEMTWIRKSKCFSVSNERIELMAEPHTDLWQQTYYHFRNDNVPLLQMKMEEKCFSLVVKTDFATVSGTLTSAESYCTWTAKIG